jgi:RNA polymerase sigma factor (TIGR02999 family)
MRLCGTGQISYHDRTHFFRLAARLMRRILVDYARGRNAEKRGDGRGTISLEDVVSVTSEQCSDALEVNELMDRLAELSPRQASVVELRYFGGLSDEEISLAIGKNVRTVRRDWAMARAWFRKQMRQK